MGQPKKQDESEEQRALAEIAAERFNRYKQVFAPLEDQYIQNVFDVRDKETYDTAGALANAEYQQSFDASNDKLQAGMFEQGVDPSSGAFNQNSAALRRAQAVRQGIGVAGAKTANTDRFYGGLKGIIQTGQGQASDAITGLGSIANTAQQRANTAAEAEFMNNSAMRSVAAAGVGYGAAPFVDKKLAPKLNPYASSPTSSPTFSGQGAN